ncbi:type II CAAX prenyl endopeptidase Rce1 family protein [Pedobacter sp. SYP-B3415]|uniref:CPBP family glutamic-type intramembrane protease n=1 Tax=Pedobacter sp. SYP-B3415 TaxID=2496641 RepID=UPI00101C590C|nr:CPBP family glutamic-type intramembrane protease [Pedobacter sp. SYP-B3415]
MAAYLRDFYCFLSEHNSSSGLPANPARNALFIGKSLLFMLAVNFVCAGIQVLLVRYGIIDDVIAGRRLPDYLRGMSQAGLFFEFVLLGPLIEELAFRGILQRNSRWFRAALVAVTYLTVCRLCGWNFYLMSLHTALALTGSMLVLALPARPFRKLHAALSTHPAQRALSWISAACFALWHYFNFNFGSAAELTIGITLLPFFINGLILNWTALRLGLLWSCLLHICNNLWPFVFWMSFR